MEKSKLIELIESDDVWTSVKHSYAEMLFEEYNSEEVRDYLLNLSKNTRDYFYLSLLK